MELITDMVSNYLLPMIDPRFLLDMLDALPGMLTGFAPYLWGALAVMLMRFQLPSLFVWVTWTILPNYWRQPHFRSRTGKDPLVSFVIASRNEGARIAATVRSVLASDWSDMEIIVVDDCSLDGSWRLVKPLEETGKVRVFRLAQHGGKPTALNLGISMASAEYVFILDGDTALERDTVRRMMGLLAKDPETGALSCTIKVANADDSLTTLYQEWEYAIAATLPRMWRAKLGLINIISGGCGLFRAEALRSVGGFDAGLGDDTDMTLRLRKVGWKLDFCHDAVVWATVPTNLRRLIRQRTRWERNMVKIRIRKHWDMALPWRYGWRNAIMTWDTFLMRWILPAVSMFGIFWAFSTHPFTTPMLITQFYWFGLVVGVMKGLICRDIAGAPRVRTFFYLPLYPFVRLPLRFCVWGSQMLEFLRIGSKHAYVPDRIWRQAERW